MKKIQFLKPRLISADFKETVNILKSGWLAHGGITKKFEETVRGRLTEMLAYFESKKILGELTLVVTGKEDEK